MKGFSHGYPGAIRCEYDLLSPFLEHVIDPDVIHAARGRRISLGHEDAPEEARRAIEEFVLDSLYRDD